MLTFTPAASALRSARTSRSWGVPCLSSSVPSRSTARSLVRRLTRRSGLQLRIYRDFALHPRSPLVLHDAVDQREEREVLADADVTSGVDARAHLAHEHAACGDALSP